MQMSSWDGRLVLAHGVKVCLSAAVAGVPWAHPGQVHLLPEAVACIKHGSSGAEAEGDLDDRHGEAVARVHIVHVVWGCKVRTCVDEAVVDECHLLHPLLLLHVSGMGQRQKDLDDRHGEAVAGVHVTRIVWGHEVRACIYEAIVDEHGIRKCAHLCKVVEHHNEHERGVYCMGCGW